MAGDWQAVWMAHSPEPIPTVDFSLTTVEGVFLGSKPTAGYRVEITAVSVQEDRVVVTYAEHRPASGSLVAQVLTSPYHLVAIPLDTRPIEFRRVETPPQ